MASVRLPQILFAGLVPATAIAAGLLYRGAPEPPHSPLRTIEHVFLAGADAGTAGVVAILVALLLTLVGCLNWRIGVAVLVCGTVLTGADEISEAHAHPVAIAGQR